MYEILIITTEGCEACNIAKNNVNNAFLQTSKKVKVTVKDRTEVSDIIKKYKIKDFPTVIYFVNGVVKYKATGSYPSAVYLRWIDLHFK